MSMPISPDIPRKRNHANLRAEACRKPLKKSLQELLAGVNQNIQKEYLSSHPRNQIPSYSKFSFEQGNSWPSSKDSEVLKLVGEVYSKLASEDPILARQTLERAKEIFMDIWRENNAIDPKIGILSWATALKSALTPTNSQLATQLAISADNMIKSSIEESNQPSWLLLLACILFLLLAAGCASDSESHEENLDTLSLNPTTTGLETATVSSGEATVSLVETVTEIPPFPTTPLTASAIFTSTLAAKAPSVVVAPTTEPNSIKVEAPIGGVVMNTENAQEVIALLYPSESITLTRVDDPISNSNLESEFHNNVGMNKYSEYEVVSRLNTSKGDIWLLRLKDDLASELLAVDADGNEVALIGEVVETVTPNPNSSTDANLSATQVPSNTIESPSPKEIRVGDIIDGNRVLIPPVEAEGQETSIMFSLAPNNKFFDGEYGVTGLEINPNNPDSVKQLFEAFATSFHISYQLQNPGTKVTFEEFCANSSEYPFQMITNDGAINPKDGTVTVTLDEIKHITIILTSQTTKKNDIPLGGLGLSYGLKWSKSDGTLTLFLRTPHVVKKDWNGYDELEDLGLSSGTFNPENQYGMTKDEARAFLSFEFPLNGGELAFMAMTVPRENARGSSYSQKEVDQLTALADKIRTPLGAIDKKLVESITPDSTIPYPARMAKAFLSIYPILFTFDDQS